MTDERARATLLSTYAVDRPLNDTYPKEFTDV